MAKRAKAKRSKTKVKRKRSLGKRPVVRKTPVKVGKKAVRKATVRKTPVRKAPARRPAPAMPPERPAPGARIGVVTHYFSHLSVAVIKLETGTLRVGDTIHIRGHTTDFSQRVESLQVDRVNVTEVGPRDDFGLKVAAHAREHDTVYKLS